MNHSTNLTLEVRSADGTASEFYQTDPKRVAQALRFLSATRVFAESQLTLASELWVTTIATRTIDVILARTNAPIPEVLPLKSPAGPIDIREIESGVASGSDDEALPIGKGDRNQRDAPDTRTFRVEVYTLGGWSNVLEVCAQIRGTVLDRRQTFAHLFEIPVIPFKLCAGGIGFINPSHLTRATAYPAPDSLPGSALPMEFLRWNPFPNKSTGKLTAIHS
jgi:hypothetical protein